MGNSKKLPDPKLVPLTTSALEAVAFNLADDQMMNNVDVSFLSHVLLNQSDHDKANFKKIMWQFKRELSE